MKKKYVAVVAIVLIAGGYFWYRNSHGESTNQVQYQTSSAKKGMISVSVSGTGQVEAVSQVDLKPVIAGDAIDVISVYVKNNQEVSKGELIALLDSEDAQKSVRNAELDLESAQNKYDQVKKDYDHDIATKYDKESQKIAVEQKKNALADAKEKLNDYYIRAPFAGVVTGLSVSAGDSISRTDILASVITTESQALISLNEVDAVRVKVGDKAMLAFDALPNVSIAGEVSKIDTIGQSSQGVVSYGAEIAFDSQNELLKPGMSISASVITQVKQDTLLIPAGAVKNDDSSGYYVEILSGGVPQRKKVEVGMSNDTEMEIVSGLSSGDEVVTQTINSSNATSAAKTNTTSTRIPGLGGFGR